MSNEQVNDFNKRLASIERAIDTGKLNASDPFPSDSGDNTMTATITKISKEVLRSYCLSDFFDADDRNTIIAKCEAIRNNDSGFYEMILNYFDLNITIEELKDAYKFVLNCIENESFDIDEFETRYNEEEGYDFTDLFAGVECFFEKLFESVCIAILSDSSDQYYFDLPDENWKDDSEPVWYEFLKEDTENDFNCVVVDETTTFGGTERTVFYFVRPENKQQLEKAIAGWAEQFIQKYTLKCTYLGYSIEREELKKDELRDTFDGIDQSQDWPEGVFKFSGTDLVNDWNNVVSWLDDEYMINQTECTETGILSGFNTQYWGAGQIEEKFAAMNALLNAAKESEIIIVRDEDGDIYESATRDLPANEPLFTMLDRADWEVIEE